MSTHEERERNLGAVTRAFEEMSIALATAVEALDEAVEVRHRLTAELARLAHPVPPLRSVDGDRP